MKINSFEKEIVIETTYQLKKPFVGGVRHCNVLVHSEFSGMH